MPPKGKKGAKKTGAKKTDGASDKDTAEILKVQKIALETKYGMRSTITFG